MGERMQPVVSIRPLRDLVLIRRDKNEQAWGRIIMPDTVQPKPVVHGEILATGPGKWLEDSEGEVHWHPMQRKPGERVVVSRYAGRDLPGSDDLVMVPEGDLLALEVS